MNRLAEDLLDLLDVSTIPPPSRATTISDSDPVLEASIGPMPTHARNGLKPFMGLPCITGWDLPKELLDRLDHEMHTQGGRKAAHVQVTKRLGPLQRKGRPRSRVMDGVVDGILQAPASPAQILADMDREAGDVELAVTGPRLIGQFLWAHRFVHSLGVVCIVCLVWGPSHEDNIACSNGLTVYNICSGC